MMTVEAQIAENVQADEQNLLLRGGALSRPAAPRSIRAPVEAIATGASNFDQMRQKKMTTAQAVCRTQERAVHRSAPQIADDYRREVRELDRLLDSDNPETREDVIPRLRSLLASIVITPARVGRGVDIEITGRLAKMIELAMGQPLGELGMLTLER